MILSLITDDVALAEEAERAGIDRIVIDLEREGKAERQAGRSLFQSTHQLDSVHHIKAALQRADLMVRINPLSERTPDEIDAVLAGGTDVVMLPYFFTPADVRSFVAMVDGRCKVSLLVETNSAAGQLAACLAAGHIDEVHIGLNDLSIELGCDVILEPMCTGVIDSLAATLREAGMPFGVGGIGGCRTRSCRSDRSGCSPSRCAWDALAPGWAGRFATGWAAIGLSAEVDRIRKAVERWRSASEEEYRENRRALFDEIQRWKACHAMLRIRP